MRVIAGLRLGRRVGEVAEDREMEVGLTIGEILHLEVLERFVHRLDAAEQRGDDHRGPELGWARPSSRKSSLGSLRGGRNAVTSWFTTLTRDVDGRDERLAGARPARRREPAIRRARARRRAPGSWPATTPPTKTTLGWRSNPALHRVGRRGAVAGRSLQLVESVVDQVVADVRSARIAHRSAWLAARARVHRAAGPPPPRGRRVRLAIASTTWRYRSRVANVIRE